MGQFVVRAVGLALLVKQRKDLDGLGIKPSMYGCAARLLSANCPGARQAIQRCAGTPSSSNSR